MLALVFAALAPFLGLLAVMASILRFFEAGAGAGAGSSHFVMSGVVLVVGLLAPIVVHVVYAGPRLIGVKRIDARTITLSRVHPAAVASHNQVV
jgi:hypothetical protein